jgi:hypothetical protein
MKIHVLTLAFSTMAALAWFAPTTEHPKQICGIVTDLKTGLPVAGAELRIGGSGPVVKADSLGKFCINRGEAASVTLVVMAPAYHSLTLKFAEGGDTVVSVKLAYAKELRDGDREKELHSFRGSRVPPVTGSAMSLGKSETEGVRRDVDVSRESPAEYYEAPASVIMAMPAMDRSSASSKIRRSAFSGSADDRDGLTGTTPGIPVKAGTLTAGEISDFSKWKLWTDLDSGLFAAYSKVWMYYARDRYAVQVINSANMPVADARALLLDSKGAVLWESRTDNTGKAELWNNLNDATDARATSIRVEAGGKFQTLERIRKITEGMNHVQLGVPCAAPVAADIMFVVDATGSMGDEIHYLKTELGNVIERAETGSSLKLRTGAVFYRDHGDEYLTRISDFTPNTKQTLQFIGQQAAGGGGDFPEAVDEGLDAAINRTSWSAQARMRLLFLVLDAPPHADAANITRMHQLTRQAAAKGIRIIPVTASGIDKSTEFLMRSLALATNGTYTFITNHSGVGGHHIEPSTDSYKVELLNNLLVRLLKEYSTMPSCEPNAVPLGITDSTRSDSIAYVVLNPKQTPNDTVKPSPNPQEPQTPQWLWKYYPNPSHGPVQVAFAKSVEALYLTDMSGKILERYDCRERKNLSLDLSRYPAGIYYLRCMYNNEWHSGKLVLIPGSR